MKLIILGSSSRGNGYLLKADTGEILMIEAGIDFKLVKRALDGDISHIAGCIVSHEHGDHAAHVSEVLAAYIPVYMHPITAEHLRMKASNLHVIKEGTQTNLSGFSVTPFLVKHDDGVPCYAYIIHHNECGFVLFATDCAYLNQRFSGLSNMLIEANYKTDMIMHNLNGGTINKKHYDHTVLGHMSIETCLETLQTTDLSQVNNIILIHLSAMNSNEKEFVSDVQKIAVGKNVMAARKGMIIKFNKTPY
nr:MAG TPA: YycJ-like protein [Caudoviricetes sp.]